MISPEKMKKKEGMTCVVCGRVARPSKLRFREYVLDGWKCACGEEYFDPEQSQQILALNKLRFQPVSAKLGRVRSNLILRIPKLVEHAFKLSEGKYARLTLKGKNAVELSF